MRDTSKRGALLRPPCEQETLRSRNVDPSALAKLFEEWMQGDVGEQQETFEELRRLLDENRLPGYKLFS
ncbi:MAG: hypothetical protein C5B51_20055 [Terriglobia bacterium]|nr:MAG: hypothetical protein C5B51_20055 [Terriglobia bacterium]